MQHDHQEQPDFGNFVEAVQWMTERNATLIQTFGSKYEFLLEVTLRRRKYTLLEPSYPLCERLLMRDGYYYGGLTSVDAEVDVLFRVAETAEDDNVPEVKGYLLGYPWNTEIPVGSYLWSDAGLRHGVTNAMRQAFAFSGSDAYSMESGAQSKSFFCLGLEDDWVHHIETMSGPMLERIAGNRMVRRVIIGPGLSTEPKCNFHQEKL